MRARCTIERDAGYLADLDAGDLDAVALLEPRDIVEIRVDRVAGFRQQLDLAQPQGQEGERGDSDQREDAYDELSGSACVHKYQALFARASSES